MDRIEIIASRQKVIRNENLNKFSGTQAKSDDKPAV